MFSSDRFLFDAESAVYRRTRAIAEELGALEVIVLARAASARRIEDGPLTVIPTSGIRFLRGLSAVRVALFLPRPDVITAQDPFEIGLAAWFVSAICRVPLHLQVHTDIAHPAFAVSSLLNRIRLLIARFLLPRAASVRAVSERARRGVLKYAPHVKVSVLPVFVDAVGLRERSRDETLAMRFAEFKTILLVVARLECVKNIPLTLDAFARAAPEDACLIIVGEGSERAQLEGKVHEFGVSDRVFFEGWRDPAPYFALADLLLITSRYEGYGLTIVESLALGTPVLATDVGIAREAGAIVVSEEGYADALRAWFARGEREGHLAFSLPKLDEYARAYADDVRRCAEGKRRL